MKLSIILNTCNHLDVTRAYLPKMIESCGLCYDMETLINDNGSTDGTREWLEHEFNPECELDIHFQKENIGNPQGLNKLLPLAQGEYIAKIDPDFRLPENWALKAIGLIENLPDIGIVGFYWARGLTHKELQKGIITKQLNLIYFEPIKVFGVWVFKRELIGKYGPFSELSKYGVWDSEFQQRLKKGGLRNIYHREDSVHMGQDTEQERIWKDAEKQLAANELSKNSH